MGSYLDLIAHSIFLLNFSSFQDLLSKNRLRSWFQIARRLQNNSRNSRWINNYTLVLLLKLERFLTLWYILSTIKEIAVFSRYFPLYFVLSVTRRGLFVTGLQRNFGDKGYHGVSGKHHRMLVIPLFLYNATDFLIYSRKVLFKWWHQFESFQKLTKSCTVLDDLAHL